MSSTQLSNDIATKASGAAAVPLRLEVVVIPVADVAAGDDYRLIQPTPPASNASIIFGKGVTSAQPGSIDSRLLAVSDIDAAGVSRGVEVSEVFHDACGGLGGGFHPGTDGRAAGPDPEGRSYGSYASFTDPDGNPLAPAANHGAAPGRV
jgi:hypothetical protein